MKKVLLLFVLVLFVACENRVVVDDENIQKPLPDGWEIVDDKTARKVFKKAELEDIVPEDLY